MNANRLSESDFFYLVPRPWEAKTNLLREGARRPKSLELGTKRSCTLDSRSKTRFCSLPNEFSEKTLAFVVLSLKKSSALRTNKLRKSKSENSHVRNTIARPQTWGPNGTQFGKFFKLIGEQHNENKARNDLRVSPDQEIFKQSKVSNEPALSVGSNSLTLQSTAEPSDVIKMLATGYHEYHGSQQTQNVTLLTEREENFCSATQETVECILREIVNGVVKRIESEGVRPILESRKPQSLTECVITTADDVVSVQNSLTIKTEKTNEPVSNLNEYQLQINEKSPCSHSSDILLLKKSLCDDRFPGEVTDTELWNQTESSTQNTESDMLKSALANEEETFSEPLPASLDQGTTDKEAESQETCGTNCHIREAQEGNTSPEDDLALKIRRKRAGTDEPSHFYTSLVDRGDIDIDPSNDAGFEFSPSTETSSSLAARDAVKIVDSTDSKVQSTRASEDSLHDTSTAEDAAKHNRSMAQTLDSSEFAVVNQSSDNMFDTKEGDDRSLENKTHHVLSDGEENSVNDHVISETEIGHLSAPGLAEGVDETCRKSYARPILPDQYRAVIQDVNLVGFNTPSAEGGSDLDPKTEKGDQKFVNLLDRNEESIDKPSLPVSAEQKSQNRPTSLFYGKWSAAPAGADKLAILRDLNKTFLNPDVGLEADLFSEETEQALESVRHLARQDSFASTSFKQRPKPPQSENNLIIEDTETNIDFGVDHREKAPAILDQVDSLVSTPTNSVSFLTADHQLSEEAWQKCRSLPAKLKPDYAGFDLNENDDDFNCIDSLSNVGIAEKTKRDSTISRESAASSGTVVASDDDGGLAKTVLIPTDPTVGCAHSDNHIPTCSGTDDSANLKNTIPPMKRTKSLDRHSGPKGVLLSLKQAMSPGMTKHGRRTQRRVNAAISAPVVNVTTPHTETKLSNDWPLSSESTLAPTRSSSSLSFVTQNSDESNPSSWDSKCSSVPSSPTISPRHAEGSGRNKFKVPKDQEIKVAASEDDLQSLQKDMMRTPSAESLSPLLSANEVAHYKKKDLWKGANKRRLVHSAVLLGDHQRKPRTPWGDSFRMSWDLFLKKLLENQPDLQRRAKDACAWLRAAGFPQYAQLYEAGSFPVDTESAVVDHDFLSQDDIGALIRRLNLLNKCASMKLDKMTNKDAQTDEDDDEYEECAISDYWHFEQNGRRWSRLDSKSTSSRGVPSITSPTNLSFVGEAKEDPATEVFDGEDADHKPVLDGQSRTTALKSKPKSGSFLKRVGGDLIKFRTSSFRKRETLARAASSDAGAAKQSAKGKSNRKNRKIEIGQPTLQSGHEKLDKLRCVPIEPSYPDNPHWRKDSVHSLTSSSSSSGSGTASSASTPAPRMRSFTEDYILNEDQLSPGLFDRNRTLLEGSSSLQKARSQTLPDPETTMFLMPKDHVPGTFPASIRPLDAGQDDEYQASRAPTSSSSVVSDTESQTSQKTANRPASVYDNLPESALQSAASAHDLLSIMDPSAVSVSDSGVYVIGSEESLDVTAQYALDAAFWSVDDIVEHTQSLQQAVSAWDDEDEEKATNSEMQLVNATEQTCPNITGVLPSCSSENVSLAEDEIAAPVVKKLEPRNSFRQTRLRWQSFKCDHTPRDFSQPLQLHNLSVGQLMMLRRLSLLRLTTLLDRFNTTKGSGSWFVPRFIRRMKVPDYKDKAVFGVPLLHNMQRFGQPLPQCIQHALAYLRRTALDQVGLFRKPGVRSRILKLRSNCENNPMLTSFEECSAYDVADMVKQYFRELPDPLMTLKLSETFIGIFLHVPKDFWLQTLQAAITLLPDESRETLQTLLCFLSDVAARSSENQMNETNLATCFAPSLFFQQFGSVRSIASSSPKVRKQQGAKTSAVALGRPDMKEMNENVAANECLAFMIRHVKNLFMISEDAMTQCRMSVMQQNEDVLADEIGCTADMTEEADYYADFHAYVDRTVTQVLREEHRISQNKGGWQSVPGSAQGCELMCKKMHDGNPLRLWRCQIEVTGASLEQLAERILSERHLWDDDLLDSKVLQHPDERTQLFQIVQAEMSPHPTRDYCVLRSWRSKVNTHGSFVIVETSSGQQPLLGDVRGVVLTSRYIIDPTDNPQKCILTRQCRVDTKGRNPEWYNKAYGHILSQQLLQVSESILRVPPKCQ